MWIYQNTKHYFLNQLDEVFIFTPPSAALFVTSENGFLLQIIIMN